MKKFLSLLPVFLLSIALIVQCFAYTPDEKLLSEKAIIMNLQDDDVVLYEVDSQQRTQPCTLTKIMTAILAIESAEDISKVDVTCSPAFTRLTAPFPPTSVSRKARYTPCLIW